MSVPTFAMLGALAWQVKRCLIKIYFLVFEGRWHGVLPGSSLLCARPFVYFLFLYFLVNFPSAILRKWWLGSFLEWYDAFNRTHSRRSKTTSSKWLHLSESQDMSPDPQHSLQKVLQLMFVHFLPRNRMYPVSKHYVTLIPFHP